MFYNENEKFENICEKSLLQWLDEMEQHDDIAVRCGVKLARDYIAMQKKEIENLKDQGRLKDSYLKRMKEKYMAYQMEEKHMADQRKDIQLREEMELYGKEKHIVYQVKDIIEEDFGCEGRPEGDKPKVTVVLSKEESKVPSLETRVQVDDASLYAKAVNVGDWVYFDEHGDLQKQ